MLWHAFRFEPSAALAVVVCLATIFWCFWLLQRSVYYTLDRFLLGFIGLLAIYQGLRLLKEVGLVTVFSSRTLNNIVELTVALLYLLAALIMRLSSEQRRLSDFQVRSARAEPRQPLKVTPRAAPVVGRESPDVAKPVPILTDPALKLFFYLYSRTEPYTGRVTVGEEALLALRKDFDELSSLLKELEQQGVCQMTNHPTARPIIIQLLLPWRVSGPAASEFSSSLTALDGQVRDGGAGTFAEAHAQEQQELRSS